MEAQSRLQNSLDSNYAPRPKYKFAGMIVQLECGLSLKAWPPGLRTELANEDGGGCLGVSGVCCILFCFFFLLNIYWRAEVTARLCWSEVSFPEFVFSSHHVDPPDRREVVRLGAISFISWPMV